MSSSFFKIFIFSVSIVLTIIFLIFIPIYYLKSSSINFQEYLNKYVEKYELNGVFLWPAPGYTRITSGFGYRVAPASGASTYHSGIDIGAPTGTNIVSAFSGIVTFIGFKGAGGYTITITNSNFSASYCHVSPNFIVEIGQNVQKGQIIGNVGPKYVYDVPNNPYKDKSGNPTNGATTGPHLHFTLRKDGNIVNPLDYL